MYGADEMSEWVKDSLEEFVLDDLDLLLSLFMFISLEMLLTSTEYNIAEKNRKEYVFALSLLDATIQDGGMRERSNGHNTIKLLYLILIFFSFSFIS